MDYVGYAGLFITGMVVGITIAIARMRKALLHERYYADRLRQALDATEYRYSQLSHQHNRLKNTHRNAA